MYLDIKRTFDTTFRTEVYACSVCSIFKFFSAKCPSAMDADMNMDERVVIFAQICGHYFRLSFALRVRENAIKCLICS